VVFLPLFYFTQLHTLSYFASGRTVIISSLYSPTSGSGLRANIANTTQTERERKKETQPPIPNNNGAMAGTIDCGRALATFIKPKSFAASSLLGKIRVTKAMSTDEKAPKPIPKITPAIMTAVRVGTKARMNKPIKIITEQPYKNGFCFLTLSDNMPPKILALAVAVC
jgi:hypothetical protein